MARAMDQAMFSAAERQVRARTIALGLAIVAAAVVLPPLQGFSVAFADYWPLGMLFALAALLLPSLAHRGMPRAFAAAELPRSASRCCCRSSS